MPKLPLHSSVRRHSPLLAKQSIINLAEMKGSLYPILRANPFPEVTDLFCRIPLSTLFYRPEAANLGDLMRLWVRSGVRINLSLGFSWVVVNAPDTPENEVLCRV
jgi:hypothetical protein